MFKYALAMLLAVALVAPAAAVVYPTNGANPQNITITLVIPCYTQVYWNNTADQNIVFNDTVQNGSNGGDWYSTALVGAYGPAPKASQDAFATDYYESYDSAYFWLNSNCNCTMQLTPASNLLNGTFALPTWFTIALTNGTGTANGFIDGNTRQNCGLIPGDGLGCYANDAGGGVLDLFGPGGVHAYPNQHPFPMAGGPAMYTGNFNAFAQGTVLFHARVLRSGLADAGGIYTTTLAVNFF